MATRQWITCLLLFSVVLSISCSPFKSEGEDCYLKNGFSGICTLLTSCPAALKKLESKSSELPEFCVSDKDHTTAIVCCDIKKQATTIRPKEIPKIDTQMPGNVAKHQCQEYGKSVIQVIESYGLTYEKKYVNDSRCRMLKGNGFIVGGEDAELGDFPHAVAIGFGNENSTKWGCSGSLISDQWILTTAHCSSYHGYGSANFARVGFVHFNSTAGQVIEIVDIIKNPKYNGTYHDIALMKLASPVTFSVNLRPACLQYTEKQLSGKVFAAGWGYLFWNSTNLSNTLQKIVLNIYSKKVCEDQYNNDYTPNGFVSETQLCIGDLAGGHDTCGGDSGGGVSIVNPDVDCMHEVIGCTKGGTQFCADWNSAGIYTRVYPYIDWIEKIVWREFF